MKIWALRVNAHDKDNPQDMMEDVFLKNSTCHVRGGETTQSFEPFNGEQERYTHAISEALPDKDATSIRRHVMMNLDFVMNIQCDDIIVVPYKRKLLYVGKVTGNYEFDGSKPQDQKHSRNVGWFENAISKKEIGADHFNNLFSFSRSTIFELKSDQAKNILKRYYPNEIE